MKLKNKTRAQDFLKKPCPVLFTVKRLTMDKLGRRAAAGAAPGRPPRARREQLPGGCYHPPASAQEEGVRTWKG